MSRSVNMAVIIGNMTRDPEMRYTPNGQAVTTFSVATNRKWVSEGVEKEEVEFHNIVAWNKLAELCSQLLTKGRKVYIQGRIQTRNWNDAQGAKHYKTEIVAEDMVILDSRKDRESSPNLNGEEGPKSSATVAQANPPSESNGQSKEVNLTAEEAVNEEEIPF